jgi:hypothetical protein
MSLHSMKMIYYSCVHSILSYGIIFGCNAPYNKSIFIIQKIIIRVITSSGRFIHFIFYMIYCFLLFIVFVKSYLTGCFFIIIILDLSSCPYVTVIGC